MPKLEEALIDRLTLRTEVREKARAVLRLVYSKTGPGTGYDIGEAKTGLPAICAYIASKSAGYADITQEVAQKASCLAPKTFASTLKTVKTAILASNTPNASPSKSGNRTDPTVYATLISEHKIGQPLRVESWMKEAQAALVVLPRFRNDFASRLSESGPEVRLAVFFWVCRAIKLTTVQSAPLVEKYSVSSKTLSRLVKTMEDECVDLKESIRATIKEMRLKKATSTTEARTSSKTPTSTPSRSQPQSRSASPTKSALRDTSKPPLPSSASSSPTKRKVAFSLSDASASSENDDVFAPETPSKRPRTTPRRAAAAAATPTRVLPVRKAATSSSSKSISSEEGQAEEDVEMLDASLPPPPAPPPLLPPTPRRLVASEPVAGPSTPRRRSAPATPTHAYRTPRSARIQMLSVLSGDEEDEGVVDEAAADEEAAEDDAEEEGGDGDGDTLPLSRRFRPVFLDRAQWALRAPRLARDRAAAERRMKELIERWGHPFAFLQHDATSSGVGVF